mgnify:CR=1 FL=1
MSAPSRLCAPLVILRRERMLLRQENIFDFRLFEYLIVSDMVNDRYQTQSHGANG